MKKYITKIAQKYSIGKKVYKTWDEYNEALRKYVDEHLDEFEAVKFEMGCHNCDKIIKRRPKTRRVGSATILYCNRCFKKLFHLSIKNG